MLLRRGPALLTPWLERLDIQSNDSAAANDRGKQGGVNSDGKDEKEQVVGEEEDHKATLSLQTFLASLLLPCKRVLSVAADSLVPFLSPPLPFLTAMSTRRSNSYWCPPSMPGSFAVDPSAFEPGRAGAATGTPVAFCLVCFTQRSCV